MSQLVEVVRPPLGHSDTLLPVGSPVVGGADLVAALTGERALNGIVAPQPRLVQTASGG
jgi:hypothetical protein